MKFKFAEQSPHYGAIHPKRKLTIDAAAELYQKLKDYLWVVDGWG